MLPGKPDTGHSGARKVFPPLVGEDRRALKGSAAVLVALYNKAPLLAISLKEICLIEADPKTNFRPPWRNRKRFLPAGSGNPLTASGGLFFFAPPVRAR